MMDSIPAPPLPAWILRQLPQHPSFRRRVVMVDGPGGAQKMHVMSAGRGRPVLMCHGNPSWGFLWRKVIAELDLERYQVVVPDLIGLGLSEKVAAAAHTLDNHIGWLGSLIAQLDLKDLIFVGQDWGGPIGLGALARSPARVAALVILNTVISQPRVGFRPTPFHRFSQAPVASDLVFRLLGFPQSIMNAVQGDKTSIGLAASAAYLWPLRDVRTNVAPLALARMVPDTASHPSMEALGVVGRFVIDWKGPAAIVWGDRDPILGGVRGWIAKCLPQATVTRTRAGHFLQEEVPVEIAAAIDDVERQLQTAQV